MEKGTTHVGMDVHKRSIVLAMRDPEGTVSERTIPNEPKAVARWLRKAKREAPGPICCAYEAGPCGYGLQRQLQAEGIECQVIAPSLIPCKPWLPIKTDR